MKTLVEPTALALLIAVEEYGSVSAAADIVGTSQANASRSLSRAEHHLGAQLLDRGPQGTTLTAAGQTVAQHARTIIRGYHDLEAASRNLGDSPVGLRIAASNTIADHLLPHWLHVWDGSLLALTTTNSSEVIAGLHRRQWDLGFIETPEFSAGIHHSMVAHDELIVVCTPDHPMAQLDHVTITDLSTTALITREKKIRYTHLSRTRLGTTAADQIGSVIKRCGSFRCPFRISSSSFIAYGSQRRSRCRITQTNPHGGNRPHPSPDCRVVRATSPSSYCSTIGCSGA